MAEGSQAETLLPRVKPSVSEAFKGSKDGGNIMKFIYYCELYYSLASISNKALFALRLL